MKRDWKKNIIIFLASQTISIFGSSLVQYAMMWYITLKAQSGGMMTIYILSGILPTFFLSPFAGVWADRYDRKKLIILSDGAIALTTLVLAVLFLRGHQGYGIFFAAAAIRALGAGVQHPAVSALIPQIVPEHSLMRVNGINGSVQSLVMLVSPMVSGLLMSVSTIEKIFLIDVFTAAGAMIILGLFLPVEPHERARQKQAGGYITDLKEGFRYIKNHTYVFRFFLFSSFFFFLVAPVAFLTPLQVTRNYGPHVWRLTAVEITFSAGMILGGILVSTWGGFKNRVYSMALSCFVLGVLTAALGLIPVFWIYLAVMVLIGIALPFYNTPSTVLLQEKVEAAFLGRVFGVLGMISSIMMPMGMILFGPVADVIKIEWLLLGSGAALSLLGFFLLCSRVLVAAGQAKTLP